RSPISAGAPRELRPYDPIRDRSANRETIDSKAHSGFVPNPFRLCARPKPATCPPRNDDEPDNPREGGATAAPSLCVLRGTTTKPDNPRKGGASAAPTPASCR